MRVPLGVVGMIYESRPNVTLEPASLALKSGNAIILRGGSEALQSNKAIAEAIQRGLKLAGLPEHAVQVINTADRAAVGQLITLTEFVDVIVPRGGKGLIERISNEARVPVIKHLMGTVTFYAEAQADLQNPPYRLRSMQKLTVTACVMQWKLCWSMKSRRWVFTACRWALHWKASGVTRLCWNSSVF